MGTPENQEAVNRQAAEHVRRTRARLVEGRRALERIHDSVRETDEHIVSMSAWIDETERHLRAAREVVAPDADAAA